MEEELKRNKETVKFDSELLDSVREHCKTRGIKYCFFLESAAIEKLKRDS